MKKAVTLAATLVALSVGCEKDKQPETPPTHPAQPVVKSAAPDPASSGASAAAATPSGPTGTIEGEVQFTGKAPEMAALNTSADPTCTDAPKTEQSVMVSGGKLQNVLVRVIDPGLKVAAPADPVVVDQKSCWYSPHVQGAVDGQKLEVRNDDQTLHNVHAYAGAKALFNNAQPPGAAPIERAIPGDDGVVRIKCDVHPWMESYVVVNHNPYFGTSDKSGAFTLKNVPAGHHTLQAWQEKLGTKQIDVDVKPNQVTKVSFSFAAGDHP
jgi:plastocyanin